MINSVRNETTLAVRGASVSAFSQLEVRRVVADRDQIELCARAQARRDRSVLGSFLSRYTEGPDARRSPSGERADHLAGGISGVRVFPQKTVLVLAALIGLVAGLLTVFIAELTIEPPVPPATSIWWCAGPCRASSDDQMVTDGAAGRWRAAYMKGYVPSKTAWASFQPAIEADGSSWSHRPPEVRVAPRLRSHSHVPCPRTVFAY